MIASSEFSNLLHTAARSYPKGTVSPHLVQGLRGIYISTEQSVPSGYCEIHTFLHEYQMFYVYCLVHAE